MSNIDAIRASISAFLSGMKMAFITSIIGIGFSLFISRFVQAHVEKNSKLTLNDQFANVSNNSGKILELVNKLSEVVKQIRASSQNDVSLSDINNSILQLKMTNIVNTMRQQSGLTAIISKNLSTSITEQNSHLKEMAEHLKSSDSNSVKILQATVDYQQASLQNEREQLQILNANTDSISDMKVAFNQFLDDMARKNNEEFIKALNQSMQQLNEQLTEQFGENFKQLNAAVFRLNDWQENYEHIIECTVNELSYLNETFDKFASDVAPIMTENAERLSESTKSFAETSARNIAIQRDLTNTSQQLSDSIKATEAVVENLKTIHFNRSGNPHAHRYTSSAAVANC